MLPQQCYQIRKKAKLSKSKSRSKQKNTPTYNPIITNNIPYKLQQYKTCGKNRADEDVQDIVQGQNQMYRLMLQVSQKMLKLSLNNKGNLTQKPNITSLGNEQKIAKSIQNSPVYLTKFANTKLQDIEQTKQQNQSQIMIASQNVQKNMQAINPDYFIQGFVRNSHKNEHKTVTNSRRFNRNNNNKMISSGRTGEHREKKDSTSKSRNKSNNNRNKSNKRKLKTQGNYEIIRSIEKRQFKTGNKF